MEQPQSPDSALVSADPKADRSALVRDDYSYDASMWVEVAEETGDTVIPPAYSRV